MFWRWPPKILVNTRWPLGGGDLVEQRRERGFAVLQQLSRDPYILIPGSAADAPQLTEPVDLLDILTQIGVRDIVLQIGDLRAIHRGFLIILV